MELEFDADGFLAEKAAEIERSIEDNYRSLFQFSKKINYECHILLFTLRISRDDDRATLTATLFMRALEHYQATIILLRRGAIAAARVTLRALAEAIFKLCAISNNNDAPKIFSHEDNIYRLKIINKVRNNTYSSLEEARTGVTDERIELLKREIEVKWAKPLTAEEWSRLANLHEWYITHYTLLSKAVHTQVGDLDRYLDLGDNHEVRKLIYAPSIDEVPHLVSIASEILLIAASAFDQTFNVGFGLKIEELNELLDSAFIESRQGS